MALYRHTAFFRDDDGHGWTETHDWDSASSSDLDLGARAETFNLLMRSRRVPLLAGDAFYLGCRVSRYQPGAFAKVQSFPIFLDSPDPGTPNVSTVSTPMDASLLAVKVTFADATGTSRADVYLRGVWDQAIQAGQLNFNGVAGAKFGELLKMYQDALIQSGYGWIGTSANTTRGVVNGYTINPDGTITFQTLRREGAPSPDVGVGVTATFARLNNSKSILNRAIRCVGSAGVTLTSVQQLAAGPFESAGTYYIKIPAFFRYGQVSYRKLSSRKTGRPIGVGRGRLPARNVR